MSINSTSTRIYPLESIVAALPSKQKDEVNQTLSYLTTRYKDFLIDPTKKPSGNYHWVITGILTSLGGVFLSLTSYQLLPSKIHWIDIQSNPGRFVGFAISVNLIFIGIITAFVKWYRSDQRQVASIPQKTYIHTIAKITEYVPSVLKTDEIFACDDPKNKVLMIYLGPSNNKSKGVTEESHFFRIAYANKTEDSLQNWLKTNMSQHNTKKSLLKLEELYKRFRSSKKGNSSSPPSSSNFDVVSFVFLRPSSDHISEDMKVKFNLLLGGDRFGQLPICPIPLIAPFQDSLLAVKKEMTFSIMQGFTIDEKYRTKPCLLIKMHCPVSSSQKGKRKSKQKKNNNSSTKISERVLVIYKSLDTWKQLYLTNLTVYPIFFSAKNDNLEKLLLQDFGLLQKVILSGQGKDLNGVEWTIEHPIRPPS